jgi:hypothetical protein
LNPVLWNPFAFDYWSSSQCINTPTSDVTPLNSNKNFNEITNNNSITVALNRNKCVDFLTMTASKANEKFAVNAYLHWYYKFNIDKDFFLNAFENVNNMIDSYKYNCN